MQPIREGDHLIKRKYDFNIDGMYPCCIKLHKTEMFSSENLDTWTSKGISNQLRHINDPLIAFNYRRKAIYVPIIIFPAFLKMF